MNVEMCTEHLDALTAILMHNSLYKFCIAHYKSEGNKPFMAELHICLCFVMSCSAGIERLTDEILKKNYI